MINSHSKIKVLAVVASLALSSLSGCTYLRTITTTGGHLVPEHFSGKNPPTENALQIVSQESQRALLAQQSLTKYRQTYLDQISYRQADFENDNTMVDYVGKPQAVLASLAIKYGYRFVEVGHTHELPIVNFTKFYGTPEQIIVAVDSQLGDQAKISIDKSQRIITLDYQNK